MTSVVPSDARFSHLDFLAYGFIASKTVFSGLELGIFDAISKLNKNSTPATVKALSNEINIPSHRLYVILTALCDLGLVSVSTHNEYRNTKSAELHLVESSKQYYGDYLRYQINLQMYPRLTNLTKALRDGQSAVQSYQQWFANPEEAKLYSESQHIGSKGTGNMIRRKINLENARSLLDLGGGSGAIAMALCGRLKKLQCTVLDFENVVNVGKQFLKTEPAHVQNRVRFVAGSALDYPWMGIDRNASFDAIIMSYLCVSVPHTYYPQLFESAYKHLNPKNGRLIIHDFIHAIDKLKNKENSLNSNLLTSLWNVQHLVVNPDLKQLEFDMLKPLLLKAGFKKVEIRSGLAGLTRIIVAHVSPPNSKL